MLPSRNPSRLQSRFQSIGHALWQRWVPDVPQVSLREQWRTAFTAALAIGLTALVADLMLGGLMRSTPGLLLTTSMGATAVLLFVAPHSPMAQPWPMVASHLVSGVIGVACARWVHPWMLAAAVAVGGSIFVMHRLRCMHPPGAATALMAVLGGPLLLQLGFGFLLAPLLLNLGMMLLAALVFQRGHGHRYPAQKSPPAHLTQDVSPLHRLGFQAEDLRTALAELDEVVDIDAGALEAIYLRAEMQAYRRRFGEICCADIMSRDIVTVEFGTDLEQAWSLLRSHRIKALPVVRGGQYVIGIVTIIEFLRAAGLTQHRDLASRLRQLLRRSPRSHSDKPEVVGQIMVTPVRSVAASTPLVELVPLFTEGNYHHLPVLDEQGRLVGMVTQTDLIGGLYQARISGEWPEPTPQPTPAAAA